MVGRSSWSTAQPHFPDASRTTDILRTEAQRAGIGELLLCRVESFRDEHGDPTALGFDAAVEHQPDWTDLGRSRRRRPAGVPPLAPGSRRARFSQHRAYHYGDVAEHMATRPEPPYRRFPGLTPSWDNTPRRRRDGVVLTGSTPERYQRWLEACLARAAGDGGEESLVFVNAWNEWGEGNHLRARRQVRAQVPGRQPPGPSSGATVTGARRVTRLRERRLGASIDGRWRRHELQSVEAFCIFIGYPRSGHSLLGSLLDAHPEMVIAHELDVLRSWPRAGPGMRSTRAS